MFRTRYRYFKYIIIFFRLTYIFAIYQTLINDIFVEYSNIFTIIYLNDIIIYLENLNEYKKYIKIILIKLLAKKLGYKSEKYNFHKIKIDFLRFLIGMDKIKID